MDSITFPAGTLVVMVGVSGSGKTTLASQYPAPWRICLDAYRTMAADSAADQSVTPVAAQIQDLLLDARLARGLTCVVDSTNVMAHVRAGLLARARYWQRPIEAVLFDVPLEVCQQRNAARTRVVPADVLRDQHRLLPTIDQLRAEGFVRIYRVALPELAAR